MSNISFGENSFTSTGDKEKKVKAEKSKAAVEKKEEVATPDKKTVILEHLNKFRCEQEKILRGMEELYENYSTNQLSVAMNSIHMVLDKIDSEIENVTSFC